ncbi:unnamed protein product [Didymodactylos carnosus]|uniref:14-3-3 domain-containing protein n=1 Tax=Didymodactylos carnosus TaxID=1234261 RepID=A0A814I157_9BILA|nr:unnamed protein product [Didymodactylos carnosus]CAF1147595.1 unnamed protein product [Didymodactylos carnosus]CAF3790483.1 unnamed protein product [Didymodactylos carnosus]CAF3950835.1 unnamed protein product [Didymodactylos carnosus]
MSSNNSETEEEIERARLAEQSERYDDMVSNMRNVIVESNGELTNEERNLFNIAYKNVAAEIAIGEDRKNLIKESEQATKASFDVVRSYMSPTDPLRLGFALSYATYYYEILDERNLACHLAKQAFDDALAEIDTLTEATYKDSTLIMQLLRDQLTLWTSDVPHTDESHQSEEYN